MIRAVDSCSSLTAAALGRGIGVRYPGALVFANNAIITTGRSGGFAYWAFDCDAIYTQILTAQHNWRNSLSFYVGPQNATNGPAETNTWSWSQGSDVVATVTLAANVNRAPYDLTKGPRLRIYAGGDGHKTLGTLLYTSSILPTAAWCSVDLDWFFPSTGAGQVNLYINDVLDTLPTYPGGPTVGAVNWGGLVPDRFALVMFNGGGAGSGWQICDLVVSDAQGANNNTRLGPCQVGFMTFDADQLIQWGKPFPASLASTVAAISEYPESYPTADHEAPDGDASYISTSTAGIQNFYSLSGIQCFAEILGIAVGFCLRDPSAGTVDIICRWSPPMGVASDVVIGGTGGSFGPVNPTAYTTLQAISEVDLSTNTFPWLDGHIQNSWWGINCLGGSPYVTQFFLEKVTTRRAVPYTCGFMGNTCVQGIS